MSIVVLSPAADITKVLPGAAFLGDRIICLPPTPSSYSRLDHADAVLVDARGDMARARALCQLLTGPLQCPPVIVIADEVVAACLSPEWGVVDVMMTTASEAEVAMRMRMIRHKEPIKEPQFDDDRIEVGDLVIDPISYSARIRGNLVDLTYKEFELLKFMATNPGRVLTRQTLLDEVWGEGYIGGARTVDVHIRRLRAKLGSEHDYLIGTVRNVGYRLDHPEEDF
ncbi:winged helix-turn-helix domain-containing protein [Actinomyces vulturis]|uniref:winged helix-turn-helix domain-containing protein n=1 Tax=Actinomyces vulturis TaxID=1857645 RepID=UPI0008339153|nr:response regulator transcription factor [Actinomyces vulturis]